MLSYEQREGRLALTGAIDDTADVAGILEYVKDGALALDLGGIRYVNSIGVREWIRVQQRAAEKRVHLELHRVAVVLVHQFNIVPATRGVAQICSFFAPYVCEDCDDEHDMVLDDRLHHDELKDRVPPPMKCPKCRALMVFRDPPEIYLSFLAR